jgi:hypothetical protein
VLLRLSYEVGDGPVRVADLRAAGNRLRIVRWCGGLVTTCRILGAVKPIEEIVALVAERVASLGEEMVRTMDLGHEDGGSSSPVPWSRDFHDAAMPVYLKSLPYMYLRDLAADFRACAVLMDRCVIPNGVSSEAWSIVGSYLNNYADAVLSFDRPAPRAPHDPAPGEISPTTPSVMRLGDLVSLVSRSDAVRLVEVASQVSAGCARSEAPTLSARQMMWLQDAASGLSVVEMAGLNGWSRATMNRRLASLWKALGAESRSEAMVIATEMSLVDSN